MRPMARRLSTSLISYRLIVEVVPTVKLMASPGTPQAQRRCRDFGYRLRALREDAGLTQADLAHRADVHVTYLSEVERGRRNLSLVNIWALAEALKTTPAAFFN
jgi:DNA-binding XRE family transcriptional regulator